jgi:hypothetical protein
MTVPMLAVSGLAFAWPLTLKASAFQWIVLVMPLPMIEVLLFVIGWVALIGLAAQRPPGEGTAHRARSSAWSPPAPAP